MSFVMEPTHQRQFVELIVYLEKIQLPVAQYCFGLQNFILGILVLKMNHVEDPNPK